MAKDPKDENTKGRKPREEQPKDEKPSDHAASGQGESGRPQEETSPPPAEPAVPREPGVQPPPPAPAAAAPVQPPAQPPPPQAEKKRRRGLVGPLILITIGVIFLLNNLGVLSWTIWETLWRFWPVVLILIGMDLLIGRRSAWRSIMMVILTIIILGIVVALSMLPYFSRGPLAVQRFEYQVGTLKSAVVVLEPGVAALDVSASQDESVLASGNLTRASRETVRRSYSVSGDSARLTVRSRGRNLLPFFGFGGWSDRRWDVELGPGIPLDLEVDTGVGESTVDLTGLDVTDLNANSGIGETTITMPETGNIDGRVDSGIGSLTIIVPSSMNARITADTGIGSLHVPDRYRRDGNVYTSEGSDPEANLDLVLNGGIGDITIEETP